MKIKEELFNLCKEYVEDRLNNVKKTISSNQNALQSETKSSAGDKHETGRAMLQLEMEKAGKQLVGINQMKETLARIDISKKAKNVHLGSVIITNKGTYFLSISAGQLAVAGSIYFAISVASPIGNLLLGKQEEEEVIFNGNSILIQEIL